MHTNDQNCGSILPELIRFACDPNLDVMTRSWIFDALRDVSGQDLGDDPRLWRAWYTALTGQNVGLSRDASHALIPTSLLQS